MSLTPQQPTSPNARSSRSSFDAPAGTRLLQAIYPPPHQSKAGDLANMSPPDKKIPSPPKSIDSVLEPTAAKKPASPPNRPLAKLRPSWIGPQPSRRNKSDQMGSAPDPKHRVSVDFTSPGLQPPVYIFTSLSDPQWEAVEMYAVKQLDGEYAFVRNFNVEEGEYQYKFRLGPGDWWVCDEAKPTVDDGMGNRNNLIVAKPVQSPKQKVREESKTSPDVRHTATKPPAILLPKPSKHAEPVFTPTSDVAHAKVPLMDHEAFTSSNQGSQSQQTPEHEQSNPIDSHAHTHDLLKHEKLASTHDADSDNEAAEPYTAPLLRHESLTATSHEQEHSPLFRHESIGLDSRHHEDNGYQASNGSPVKPSTGSPAPHDHRGVDINDPSLEHFPTDHSEILKHIHRTSTRLPADETNDGTIAGSPASSNAISDTSDSAHGLPILPPVYEEGDDQLEKIRQAEEQEVEDEEKNGQEVDPLREEQALPTPPPEPEDTDFEPKVEELKALLVPVGEAVREGKRGLVEKVGQRNLMAVAVGLLAVIAGFAVVKLLR